MFILSNQITLLLNEYNTQLGQMNYPDNFHILSRDILYSPHLSIYNLDSNPSVYSSRNFENINLGKYLYDKISYQTIQSDKFTPNSNTNLLLTNNEYPYVIPNITLSIAVVSYILLDILTVLLILCILYYILYIIIAFA